MTSLFPALTCLPVGPTSLDWPVNPFGRSGSTGPLLPPMLPVTDYDVCLLLLLNVLAGGRVLFKYNHRFYNALQGEMVVAPSFLKAYDVLLGILGAWSDLSSPDKGAGNLNLFTSKSFLIVTTSFACRKCMARTSFFRLFKCWLLNFVYLALFFLTMKMREDRLSAFIGTFYLKRLL